MYIEIESSEVGGFYNSMKFINVLSDIYLGSPTFGSGFIVFLLTS